KSRAASSDEPNSEVAHSDQSNALAAGRQTGRAMEKPDCKDDEPEEHATPNTARHEIADVVEHGEPDSPARGLRILEHVVQHQLHLLTVFGPKCTWMQSDDHCINAFFPPHEPARKARGRAIDSTLCIRSSPSDNSLRPPDVNR